MLQLIKKNALNYEQNTTADLGLLYAYYYFHLKIINCIPKTKAKIIILDTVILVKEMLRLVYLTSRHMEWVCVIRKLVPLVRIPLEA
jgi:hypothetical protein